MALVYSYIRYSTKLQDIGDSLRRQVEDGQRWIDENGHTLAESIQDRGVSAFRGRHRSTGALAGFLDRIRDGTVLPGSILLVENLDRLSRQKLNEAKKLFEEILENGIEIAVLRPYPHVFNEESVNKDPMSLMLPLWAFHLAHMESKNKSDRLRSAWQNKRAKLLDGDKLNRRCPSWLEWDEKCKNFKLRKGWEAILTIFEMTAEGIGQRKILATLVEKFSPIGSSGQWNSSFIAKVVNDRAVLGELQPRTLDEDGHRIPIGEVVKDYYPRVIPDELWHRAQSAKSRNLKSKGPSSKFVNLFVGLIFNAHDRSAMQIQTTRTPTSEGTYVQRRLVSYAHLRKDPRACPVTIDYAEFERITLEQLSELRLEDLESVSGVSELRSKEQEMNGLQDRLRSIEEALEDPTGESVGMLIKAASTLRTRLAEVEKEIGKLREAMSARAPLEDAQRIIADGIPPAKRLRLRAMVGELIEGIYLKPEKHYGRVWTLVQICYRSGLSRFLAYGPGGVFFRTLTANLGTSFPEIEKIKNLRDGCERTDVLGDAARLYIEGATAKPDTSVIPDRLSDAAELYLADLRSRMNPASYRVVPSKVRRFVEYCGDVLCADLDMRDWQLFLKYLNSEVVAKKLEKATARVNLNRAREFLNWLMSLDKCRKFNIDGSSKILIP